MIAALLMFAAAFPQAFDAGWNGEKVCEVLQETAHERLARCTFPPGVGHEKHRHGAHVGYVVSGGTMRITDDKGVSVRVLNAGDSWRSAETVHEALNIGDTTAVYIIVEAKEQATP